MISECILIGAMHVLGSRTSMVQKMDTVVWVYYFPPSDSAGRQVAWLVTQQKTEVQ